MKQQLADSIRSRYMNSKKIQIHQFPICITNIYSNFDFVYQIS